MKKIMKEYHKPEIKVKEMISEQVLQSISSAEIDTGSSIGAEGAGAKMDMIQFILDNM